MSTYLLKNLPLLKQSENNCLSFKIKNVNLTIKKILFLLDKMNYIRCLFCFSKINQIFKKIYPF